MSDSYQEGFEDGVEYAARLVVKRLNEALNEPRSQPSDRAGRITTLGLLLQELAPGIDHAAAPSTPSGDSA